MGIASEPFDHRLAHSIYTRLVSQILAHLHTSKPDPETDGSGMCVSVELLYLGAIREDSESQMARKYPIEGFAGTSYGFYGNQLSVN